MDERQAHLKTRLESRREADPTDRIRPQGLRMVGRREYEALIAEGHYRCPHCRRADINEVNVTAQYAER